MSTLPVPERSKAIAVACRAIYIATGGSHVCGNGRHCLEGQKFAFSGRGVFRGNESTSFLKDTK